MSDLELLEHCYNSLTGEYGEIANTLLVETLKLRLAKQEATDSKPTGYSITTLTWENGEKVVQFPMTTEDRAQVRESNLARTNVARSFWHKE